MIYLFLLLVLPVGGFFLFRAIFDALTSNEKEEKQNKTTFVNHNYITENHLHISKEDLLKIRDKKIN